MIVGLLTIINVDLIIYNKNCYARKWYTYVHLQTHPISTVARHGKGGPPPRSWKFIMGITFCNYISLDKSKDFFCVAPPPN